MKQFPTIELLRSLSLRQLRILDIKSKEEEALVQSVIDEKTEKQPETVIYTVRVPDIKTPEQEKEWQSKVDEAVEKSKPKSKVDTLIEEATTVLKELEKEIPVVSEVIVPIEVVSQETKQTDKTTEEIAEVKSKKVKKNK
jgi:uncharacterized Zn finger protein